MGTECVAFPVSDDPDSVTTVRRANMGSGDTMPFRIIPDRIECPEKDFQSSTAKLWGVFEDGKPGPDLADDTDEFPPQAGSGSINASASTSDRDVLAGEASCEAIDGNAVSSQNIGSEISDIMIARNSRPVLLEGVSRRGFDFAECDRLEAAGAFEATAETAYAAEEIEDADHPSTSAERAARRFQKATASSGVLLHGCSVPHSRQKTVKATSSL